MKKASAYAQTSVNGKRYVLVHAGITDFKENISLDKYNILDLISGRTDYDRRYYRDQNTYVITGHTPTMYIHKDFSSTVYIGNGHIAIDCGCVYGGRLAAYCIDSGETAYVDAKECYLDWQEGGK